jgi:glycosyltransferase involved in cell wall biosynthesis
MKAPRVSVVIPVYQRQYSGAAAIRSALAQEGLSVEVIVFDDASPTPFQLPADLRGLPNVHLYRQERNGGAAAARNAAIAAATGEWIAFLDSDDQFLPGKLARQLALADPSRPHRIIACGFVYAREGSDDGTGMIPIASSDIDDFCSGCWHCPGSTALIHRRAFDTVGPLDERLRRLEDFDWFIRLAMLGGSVAVVPELGARIEVGTNRSTVDIDHAAARIRKKLGPTGRALPRSAWHKLTAYLVLEQGAARWRSGRRLSAIPYLLQSFALVPRRGLHLKDWWTWIDGDGAAGGNEELRRRHTDLVAQAGTGVR